MRLGRIGLSLTRNGELSTARLGPFLVLRPREQGLVALARALRKSFVELGPTFVKLGQLIASSPGIFPPVFSEEFRRLLDDVPPEKPATVRRIVEAGLGAPVQTLFRCFDERPRAAASIAQVHRAELRDGRVVAVKVRRPGLSTRVERDLRLLKLFALPLERAGSLGRTISPVAIAEDFATRLRVEMDLRIEAARMAEFGRNLHIGGGNPRIHVPEAIDGMVAESVLVMSFIDGDPIDTAARRLGSEAVFDVGLEAMRAWLESALRHGLFHGDVHAANIFYTASGDIALLDFGIMGELDPTWREVFRDMQRTAMIDGDYSRIIRNWKKVGVMPADIGDDHEIGLVVKATMDPLLDRAIGEISIGELMRENIRLARQFGATAPRELVLISKQLLYFERYGKELAPTYNLARDLYLIRNVFPEEVARRTAEHGITLPD